LILDIETVPDVQRWARPETPAGVEPPFPPTWAHRIIVLGYLWLDHDYRLARMGVMGDASSDLGPDDRERGLLEQFSSVVGNARPVLVTYNGRSFDLPVIALRSLAHAVPLGWYYRDQQVRDRRSDAGHLDLCDWLADHGAVRAGKLDALTRLIGLPGKGPVDGSQVEGLYQSGQLELVQKYCLGDVVQTALLFLRFRLLQGQLPRVSYRQRVDELLGALAIDGRVAEALDPLRLDRERLLGPASEPIA
jgi:predicted PolB exonuclease-like 3'-5' exonuclease